jgi:hypothetical protein
VKLFCGGADLLAAGVLAIAADFHHVRLLGLFAVLAAILAALFGRAITRWVRALGFRVLGHKTSLLSGCFELVSCILKLNTPVVKEQMSFP